MNLYYQSLIEQIQEWIANKAYDAAWQAIEQELSLPYIPQDALKELEDLKMQLKALRPVQAPSIKLEQVARLLHGSPEQQEMAVGLLEKLNLRQHEAMIQDFLNTEASPLLKGRLIEAMMDQKLDHTFALEQDGLEIEFVPSLITPAGEDLVYQNTAKQLQEWFENDNPSLMAFALTLLEQERLALRPFDFSELNQSSIAKAIARLVFEAMGMSAEYSQFLKTNKILDVPEATLMIEK